MSVTLITMPATATMAGRAGDGRALGAGVSILRAGRTAATAAPELAAGLARLLSGELLLGGSDAVM